MSSLSRGALLLCLGLQLSWSDDSAEITFTEITHEGPSKGLWSLEFDTEGYRLLDPVKQKIIARGKFDSVLVGFQLSYEPNFNFFKDSTKEPSGYISISHIGEESDNLAGALHKLFGKDGKRVRFKALVKHPVVSSRGWNSDFRSGRIEFLVKSKSPPQSDYFEFSLIVHKDKQSIWFKERKQEFREPILDAISQ